MNDQKRRSLDTRRWTRRFPSAAAILAATALAGLSVAPARAAGSCTGTYITSALEKVPESTAVRIDPPREQTPASIAAAERFLRGVQAAGARLQDNSDLRLRLVFSVILGIAGRTLEAPTDSEVYNDFTWLDPSLRMKSKEPGNILLTAQVINVSTAAISWVASIRCEIHTRDAGTLAEDLGRVVGATLWKTVPEGRLR